MTLNVEMLRADTPACNRLIHFNNAGSSLMPRPVAQAVIDHLALEEEFGGYEAEERASVALRGFYTGLAGMLGADPDEIAYVENATRAWDMAFYGLPLSEGDRILTHGSEYVSNYLGFLQQAERRGLHVDVVPSDETGQIDVAALERMIQPKTRLISITHVPTQGGLVNPVEEVGRVAHDHGLLYMLDACQSVGQMPVDVGRIGCHVLSGTGRKFLRGPRGTGFLYVAKDLIPQTDPPFIDLHAATWTDANSYTFAETARRFENFESFIAGRVGLARAVDYAQSVGLAEIEAQVTTLAANLRDQLQDVPGVSVHDRGARKCAIVTFKVDGETPDETAKRLSAVNINVSVTVRTSAQLDLGARDLEALTRASVHYFNTQDEVDKFVRAVAQTG